MSTVLKGGRDPDKIVKRIWKLFAYLGRYAHQSVDVLLELSYDDLKELADATAEILKEEVPKGARKHG